MYSQDNTYHQNDKNVHLLQSDMTDFQGVHRRGKKLHDILLYPTNLRFAPDMGESSENPVAIIINVTRIEYCC